ncbi:MAG: hypothetical protein H7Y10_03400 [Flavobacterium sp.]|nr:hypothetical protein [Flavobacterium sp.]
MKKVLLIICLFCLTHIFAQPLIFEKLVIIDSITSKEVLFERLNTRLIDVMEGQDKFNKNIIQSDKEIGVIKYKNVISYDVNEFMNSANGIISYNVNVYFKKGRFKIIIDNIIHKGLGVSMDELTIDIQYPHKHSNYLKYRNRKWVEIKEFINNEIPKHISTVEKLILTPSEQESKW